MSEYSVNIRNIDISTTEDCIGKSVAGVAKWGIDELYKMYKNHQQRKNKLLWISQSDKEDIVRKETKTGISRNWIINDEGMWTAKAGAKLWELAEIIYSDGSMWREFQDRTKYNPYYSGKPEEMKAGQKIKPLPKQEAFNIIYLFSKDDTTQQAYKNISKSDIIGSLTDRMDKPYLISQEDLMACGPAAFAQVFAEKKPVEFVRFALDLFQYGKGSFGNITITAKEIMKKRSPSDKDWTGRTMDPLDWMILATLRDSENISLLPFRDPSAFNIAAITFPGEMVNWLKSIFNEVQDETLFKNEEHIKKVNEKYRSGYNCILLIYSSIAGYTPSLYGKPIPDHYVVYRGNLEFGDQIIFDVWSWGIKTKINVPKKIFQESYYGAIFAK